MSTRRSTVALIAAIFLAGILGTATAAGADTATNSHVSADDIIWGAVER